MGKRRRKREILERKTFDEHYRELRFRLIIIALSITISTLLGVYIADDVYTFLVAPLSNAMEVSVKERNLIFTGLAEGFMVHLRLSVIVGLLMSLPVIIWQLYSFLAPGLYKKEKIAIIIYIISAPSLFFLGAMFVYYLVMPAAWSFFLSFEHVAPDAKLPIILEARVSEYLDLSLNMILAFGLAFQMPVVLALLTKIGVVTSKLLTKGRRYAIVLIFILAAILTPPDVFSQIALALPLLVLYELSVFICRSIERRHA